MSWIECCPYAMSSSAATLHMSDLRSDDFNSVVPAGSPGIEVESRTLDSITSSEVNLLKIDVEGYELAVLQGGGKVLERTVCVYFECSNSQHERFGYTSDELVGLLESYGFKVFRLRKASLARVLVGGDAGGEWENLVAVKDIPAFVRRTGLLLHE